MRRRTFLQGAAVGATALAGCSFLSGPETETGTPPTDTGSPTRTAGSPRDTDTPAAYPYAEQFDTIVDVANEGGDATGAEAINPILEANAGDDTLFYFRPGIYLMNDSWVFRRFSNVGVVGRDATITIPPDFKNYLFAFGEPGEASDLLVDGLSFDCTARNSGARVLEARIDDGLVVRDVSVAGVQEVDFAATRFDLTSSDGTGVIERLRLPDGGAPHTRAVGCYVGDQSIGELSFRNCRMESFPNNGLYASSSKGPLLVEGGYYANNGISSVRVGNGGVVRNVHVRCDDPDSEFPNMRGIRLRNGASTLVENCRVELLGVSYSDGAIVVEEWLESATIRDTTVRIDADGISAIRAKAPAPRVRSDAKSRPSLECQNVSITGSADQHTAVDISSRDGCVFDGVSIQQGGADRDGIHLGHSRNNRIRDSVIDVTGRQIVLVNASIDTGSGDYRTTRRTDSSG